MNVYFLEYKRRVYRIYVNETSFLYVIFFLLFALVIAFMQMILVSQCFLLIIRLSLCYLLKIWRSEGFMMQILQIHLVKPEKILIF